MPASAPMAVPLVDLSPVARLMLLAAVVALLPLGWWWLRQRGADRRGRAAALTLLTLFLTFDLVVFGSFTRLTDSGLGCPDWPGCYGQTSPIGAAGHIGAAEAAMPTGPVTHTKAWIEMIHRYLAMTVGVLILVMAAEAWTERWRREAMPVSPWWPTATLVWVVLQGLAGKYTVTLQLYPAVVTLHLLGGLTGLVLLAAQRTAYVPRPLELPARLRRWILPCALLLLTQILLGGWVSTNYAVLACPDFPRCHAQWWPPMDWHAGFEVLRPLGQGSSGSLLPFDALVAIHMAHRLFAIVAVLALLALAVAFLRASRASSTPDAASVRRFGLAIGGVALVQVGTGLSNIVLGWPLAAALLHSAGAAALTLLLALAWLRSRRAIAAATLPREGAVGAA